MGKDRVLSFEEVVEKFGIDRETLQHKVTSGEIPSIRIGGIMKFREDDVAKALGKGEDTGPTIVMGDDDVGDIDIDFGAPSIDTTEAIELDIEETIPMAEPEIEQETAQTVVTPKSFELEDAGGPLLAADDGLDLEDLAFDTQDELEILPLGEDTSTQAAITAPISAEQDNTITREDLEIPDDIPEDLQVTTDLEVITGSTDIIGGRTEMLGGEDDLGTTARRTRVSARGGGTRRTVSASAHQEAMEPEAEEPIHPAFAILTVAITIPLIFLLLVVCASFFKTEQGVFAFEVDKKTYGVRQEKNVVPGYVKILYDGKKQSWAVGFFGSSPQKVRDKMEEHAGVSLAPAADGAEEKPADEAEEKPTEEAKEKPAEEKPAEEKPAEEKPAEEKPAEEKPAEEKPAE